MGQGGCGWEDPLQGQEEPGARCQWLPVIPASQEAEIRRIRVQSQHRQIVHEALSQKNLHKKEPVEALKV
jgi:hypothetical protein